MPAVGRAATACHASLQALHGRALKLWNRCCCYLGSSSSGRGYSPPSSTAGSRSVVLAALLCFAAAAALFPRAVAFFLPLVASTSAFCATAYVSASTDLGRGAAKEVVLVRGAGAPAEAGTLQVCADADASAYGSGCGAMQVGCFLRKWARRGLDADGEEVVLAGRILVPAPAAAAALEEELASLQVDRLAEGVWDSYFGRWSTWNHYLHDAYDD
jgi:hypothetical protein